MTIALEHIQDGDWAAVNRVVDVLRSLVLDTGGRSLRVRFGVVTITGTGAASATATVTHGLGTTPIGVTGNNIDGFTTQVVTFDTLGSTTFNMNSRDSRETAWTGARLFFWVAIG